MKKKEYKFAIHKIIKTPPTEKDIKHQATEILKELKRPFRCMTVNTHYRHKEDGEQHTLELSLAFDAGRKNSFSITDSYFEQGKSLALRKGKSFGWLKSLSPTPDVKKLHTKAISLHLTEEQYKELNRLFHSVGEFVNACRKIFRRKLGIMWRAGEVERVKELKRLADRKYSEGNKDKKLYDEIKEILSRNGFEKNKKTSLDQEIKDLAKKTPFDRIYAQIKNEAASDLRNSFFLHITDTRKKGAKGSPRAYSRKRPLTRLKACGQSIGFDSLTKKLSIGAVRDKLRPDGKWEDKTIEIKVDKIDKWMRQDELLDNLFNKAKRGGAAAIPDSVAISRERVKGRWLYRFLPTFENENFTRRKHIGITKVGTVGLDLGTGAYCLASDSEITFGSYISCFSESLKRFDDRLASVNREIDILDRIENPDRYNENGTPRRKREVAHLGRRNCSDVLGRLYVKRREIYRKRNSARKQQHAEFAQLCRSLGDKVILEQTSFSGWQRNFKSVQHQAPAEVIKSLERHFGHTHGEVVKICPFTEKATKTCCKCGHLKDKGLGERFHICDSCNLVIPRDANASVNLMFSGRPVAEKQSWVEGVMEQAMIKGLADMTRKYDANGATAPAVFGKPKQIEYVLSLGRFILNAEEIEEFKKHKY